MTDQQILEGYEDIMRKAEEQCPGGLQMVRDIEQVQRAVDLANAIEERTVTSRELRLQPEDPPHEWAGGDGVAGGACRRGTHGTASGTAAPCHRHHDVARNARTAGRKRSLGDYVNRASSTAYPVPFLGIEGIDYIMVRLNRDTPAVINLPYDVERAEEIRENRKWNARHGGRRAEPEARTDNDA